MKEEFKREGNAANSGESQEIARERGMDDTFGGASDKASRLRTSRPPIKGSMIGFTRFQMIAFDLLVLRLRLRSSSSSSSSSSSWSSSSMRCHLLLMNKCAYQVFILTRTRDRGTTLLRTHASHIKKQSYPYADTTAPLKCRGSSNSLLAVVFSSLSLSLSLSLSMSLTFST